MQERVISLRAPSGRPLPVVIPSYNGARKQANLTPLLALLLSRLGLPVVVHGVTEDSSRDQCRDFPAVRYPLVTQRNRGSTAPG